MNEAIRSKVASYFGSGGKFESLPSAGFYSGISGTEQIHQDLIRLLQACYLAHQTYDYSGGGYRRMGLFALNEEELQATARAYCYLQPPELNRVPTQIDPGEENGICGYPSAQLATAFAVPTVASLISGSIYSGLNWAAENPMQLLLDGFKGANEDDKTDTTGYSQRVRVSIGEVGMGYRATLTLYFTVAESLIFQPANVQNF
ncbi:MAG: hypothetical protein HC825_01665 [Oscillatoriales cyanobacterium RM1_1_9]|nr:hypothetical protein [Oscillatoriales cyanobacterium RM1_1_9]